MNGEDPVRNALNMLFSPPYRPSLRGRDVVQIDRETTLVVIPLPGHPLLLALTHDPLTEPLRREARAQRVQVINDILAALGDGVFRSDGAVGRDAELEAGEERVRDFVGGEGDAGVFEKALGEEIRESVVLFVEREYGGVGNAWESVSGMGGRSMAVNARVSFCCSTFFSSSSSRNSSNLASWLASA